MVYYEYSIVRYKDAEISRLRKLLADNGIDYGLLQVGHSTLISHMTSEYYTLYRTPVKLVGRITKRYPVVSGKRARIGFVNSYGWRVVAIYEIYKLVL